MTAPDAPVNIVTSLVEAIPVLAEVPTFILYPSLMLVGAVLGCTWAYGWITVVGL